MAKRAARSREMGTRNDTGRDTVYRIIIVVAALTAAAITPTSASAVTGTDAEVTNMSSPAADSVAVIEVAPTSADLTAVAAEDKAEGITSSVRLHCYHNYAYENWHTRADGTVWFYDRVTNWCGRPYVHVYKSTVTGFADWQIPTLWNESGASWTKGWVDGQHLGVITTAQATLYLEYAGQRLQTIHAHLCMNVYANGFAKVTCHN